METSPYRPRVSRETRLLLTAGVLAIATLWLLARVRFPERPVTPNPVPSVLSQLARGPNYDDLAGEIAQLQARLQPSLLALELRSPALTASQTAPRTAAIRLRDDLAVMLVPAGSKSGQWNDGKIVARDPASGLAIARVPLPGSASPPVPWTPRQPQQARYLVASDVSRAGVSLRPVFVGSLDAIASPLWSEPIWAVPGRTDLVPGSFLFTSSAELAGLVMPHGGGLAIVPGAMVLAEADRLLGMVPAPPGALGIEVQDLTASVASVTGALAGVVVTWTDAAGAAKGQLTAGDVIEAVDGLALASRQAWDVRVARLEAGETLTLRVRRRGELREVRLTAGAAVPPSDPRSLGLTLRARARIGVDVVRVEPGSAAERAGLTTGDVITLVGELSAPTPAQVMRSFAAVGQGQRVLIAVTRGSAHFVTTLER
jgi:S1-C subfamily serine protease